MSVDKTKCCGIHTQEKEDKGECCQQEEQERAEALTYEQSFVNKVHSVVYMDKMKEQK